MTWRQQGILLSDIRINKKQGLCVTDALYTKLDVSPKR